ncbi:cytochrome P450 4d2-like [Aricia agestis]|uniref:cytochrome P450 4d2-like n=1 Tax=Aricia agestis TaxID=91739 RepID=UPI001C206B01|nr:cytochrome P450 4d2-like [Aricia agestis]
MIAVPLLLFLVFVFAVYVYSSQDESIPGPMRIPLLGCVRLWMTKPSEFIELTRYFKDVYGDAYLMYMFDKPHVVLSHPKYIAPLLSSSEHIVKGRSYIPLKDWLGRGLLTDAGHRWKTFRRLLTPAFHFNILQTILQVFLKNEETFIKKLKKYADSGEAFDLFPIVALLSLDNVTESIMGVEMDSQNDSGSEYVKAVTEMTRIIAYRIQNPLAGNDTLFSFMSEKKVYDRSLEILHETTRKVIKLRRQALIDQNITSLGNESEFGIKNKNAFLDLLLLSEVDGAKIDDETIREQVDTFMFEGHDTTSSAVVYTLFCLSKHPDIQQKVLDEQQEILQGDIMYRDPTFTEVNQMRYLEMVIKESLRIFPSVPIIERIIKKDVDLNGLKIKANTSIMINILEVHRHPELHEDPLVFRPERFDLAKQTDKNTFNWIAFSAGPRNCIGQKFAMMEIKVMVASVLKHYKLLPVDEEPKLCSELVLRSQNGVKIRLAHREKVQ